MGDLTIGCSSFDSYGIPTSNVHIPMPKCKPLKGNNSAVLILAEDWEGLFVNGELVEEGHTLNEGMSRIQYFIQLAKQYDFVLEEMKEFYVDDEDENYLYDNGSFPLLLTDLIGDYTK